MKTLKFIYFLFFLFFVILLSCRDDESNANFGREIKVNGYVQKGPFTSGSKVIFQELDDKTLAPSGLTYFTNINNDFGGFTLNSKFSSQFVEIFAEGFYFNEVSGELSEAPLSLNAFVETKDSLKVNVNILTTLTKDRIKNLIVKENKDYRISKLQAEKEVLEIFGINESINDFESLDISKNRSSDAILLAISATLQSYNSVGQLSELLSKINLDLKEDGKLETGLQMKIRDLARRVPISKIGANLSKRYLSLGLNISIPKYENYLDSDGDGIINAEDKETYYWKFVDNPTDKPAKLVILNNQLFLFTDFSNKIWKYSDNDNTWAALEPQGLKFDSLHRFKPIAFKNKIYLFGTERYPFYTNYNAIYFTSDGTNWQSDTTNVDLGSTDYFEIVAMNNKLWKIDRFNNTSAGVWNSDDGVNWTKISGSPLKADSYNTYIGFQNKIIIVSSKTVGNKVSNDILFSSDGLNWRTETLSSSITPRFLPSIIAYKDNLMLIGGQLESGEFARDIWFSADGTNWTESENFSRVEIPLSYIQSTAVLNNKIWAVSDYDLFVYENLQIN